MKKILYIFILILTTVTTWAAVGKSKKKTITPDMFKMEVPQDDYVYMSDDIFLKFKKTTLNTDKNRDPQAAKVDFVDPSIPFSADYLNYQAKLIGGSTYEATDSKRGLDSKRVTGQISGITTPDQLAALIDGATANTEYDKLSNDAKFIVASLATMKPYRGLAFRARPLFDKNNLVHSYMIFALRQSATGINIFMPTPQWKAGFDYIVEPLPVKYRDLTDQEKQQAPQKYNELASTYIDDEVTFFRYINYEVLPSLNLYIKRLKSLVEASEQSDFKPFYFDNRLVVSTAQYADRHDRFIKFGPAEVRLALASALYARSAIYASLSYSWTNLFKAMEGVARNYGFQAAFDVDMTTAEMRNKRLNQPGLFVLKNPGNMPKAYADLQESCRQTLLAWNWLKNRDNIAQNPQTSEIMNLIDPRVLVPMDRVVTSSLENITSLFDIKEADTKAQDRGRIKSAVVQGEAVPVNLYNFFHGQTIPQDLKKFMPTTYAQGPKQFKAGDASTRQGKLASIAGGPIRNYLQGSPNGWDVQLYQTYFPAIKSNDDVVKTARILSQAWGGWIIGIPFAAMVL